MKTLWLLYCALQAAPMNEPPAHLTFDTEERCRHQAEVSTSFGDLRCVCTESDKPPFGEPFYSFTPL
jgi:hypothetical protein